VTIVSYAQNFEDVMLWRALGHIKRGQYLDVGAQDPVVDSVSRAFYEAGWRGIHVEPTPFYAGRLREARPDEIVIEAAVTSAKGLITFYEIPETGLSTGDKEIAATHVKAGFESRELVVPSIRLAELLRKAKGEIHWLKIDVEGMEADVLRSWGKSPRRPWVLIIESTYPNSQEPTHQQWIDEVLRRGYRHVHFDGLSRFFIHADHDELAESFDSGANVFDGFGIAPSHWATREVDRACQERLEAAGSEASQRETELRAELGGAQQRAAAEQDQARDAVLSAKAQLEAASRHHHETLAALAAETDRLRSDADSANARLVEVEREHREALVQQWRERQAATELSFAERIKEERALRREHDQILSELRRRAEQIEEASRQAAEHVRLERIQLGGELDQARAEAAWLRTEVAQASNEREDTRAEVAWLRTVVAETNNERDDARAEVAWLRTEVAEASNARDHARAEAERIRAAAEQADALMRNAIDAHSGLWQRIGQVLGLSRPLRIPLRPENSLLIQSPRFDATHGFQPAHESEPAMPSFAQPASRNPYLAAHSLTELLSWPDIDFVRCAYVTMLGRQPDADGEAFYTDLVRGGASKWDVLARLRQSIEGRDHDPGIAGLDKAIRRHRNANLPLIGAIIRAVTRREGNSAFERRVRALDNQVAVARLEQQRGFSIIWRQFELVAAAAEAARVNSQSMADSMNAIAATQRQYRDQLADNTALGHKLRDQLANTEATTDRLFSSVEEVLATLKSAGGERVHGAEVPHGGNERVQSEQMPRQARNVYAGLFLPTSRLKTPCE